MASERTASQGCPETYFCTPTPHVPNSPLPVLVYRSVLLSAPGRELSAETARATLEQNQWLQGGVFGHYPAHHYHSVTHECYAVFSGRSRFLLGKGPLDSSSDDDGKGNSSSSASSASSEGIEVDLAAGDIIVQPAGVAHCCLRSSEDFAYIGVYPKVRATSTFHVQFPFIKPTFD